MDILLIGFLIGCAFGAILFLGGATSYRKILGTLLLRDMTIIKLMLTAIGVGIVGLVLGVAAGGVLPRAELRELQAQLDEAQSKACETDRGAIGREFASALRGRPVSGAYDDRDVPAVETADEPPAIDEGRPQTLEDIEREIEERSEAGADLDDLAGGADAGQPPA